MPTFTQRIDYIFTRGFDRGNQDVVGEVRRFGINPERRPVGPLGEIWISDHAGVLATLRLPPPKGGNGRRREAGSPRPPFTSAPNPR